MRRFVGRRCRDTSYLPRGIVGGAKRWRQPLSGKPANQMVTVTINFTIATPRQGGRREKKAKVITSNRMLE